MKRWRGRSGGMVIAGVAVLLVTHVILILSSSPHHSATYDEVAFVTGGYSYWTKGDFRLHSENGVLPQLWLTLPLLAMQPVWPAHAVEEWSQSNVWGVAHQFLYESSNDAQHILFAARSMSALASVVLGLVVFVWSKRLFGVLGGFVSLVLYAFSPTVIANAGLATGDILTAALLVAGVGSLWLFLHRVSWSTVLLVGLSIPLLVLAKASWMLLGPMALVMVVTRLIRLNPLRLDVRRGVQIDSRLGQAMFFAGAASALALWTFAVIWAAYGFRYSAVSPGEPFTTFIRPWEFLHQPLGTTGEVLASIRDARLLPEAFVYGLSFVLAFSQQRQAFILGEYSVDGWWYFFPFTFLVKSSIAELVTIGLTVGAAVSAKRRGWSGAYNMVPLLTLIVVYAGVSVTSSLNIGHRHILPIYPAILILAGSAAAWLKASTRLAGGLLVVALVTAGVEAVWIWPHHLAYFNQLAGGPSQGYRQLVDSSLDWGQDLPSLKRYLVQRELENGAEPVYLAYFGTASPTWHGISARRLPSYRPRDQDLEIDDPLAPGVYCISATMLQNMYMPTFGQWSTEFEAGYVNRRADLDALEHMMRDPTQQAVLEKTLDIERIRELRRQLRVLEFGRLTRYLLQREPDDRAGYSILIYRVSAEELQAALRGAPVELFPTPQIKGR